MLFQPYLYYRNVHIGRNQYIFLRMLTNCMEEVGLTLPLRMDDIHCIMPDEYNESMRWNLLISLHHKGLITFNPMTGSIVDIDLSLLKYVSDGLRRNKCCLYEYYQEPWDIRRMRKKQMGIPNRLLNEMAPKKGYLWSKTVVRVPLCPDYHA